MAKDARFWRNVILIGAAHGVVIFGLIRWGRESEQANAPSVVWMNGGAGDGTAAQAKVTPLPKAIRISTPIPVPPKKEEHEEEPPVLASAKSEIQLSTPTATPKPTPTGTPKATPKPSPKATPKSTPKPTAKPTPKKAVIAKATPKPTPKATATPEKASENDDETNADAAKKEIEKAAPARDDAGQVDSSDKPPKAVAANAGTGKGTSAGAGGHPGGSGGQSQFGWYGSMLHDRFYSEWVQPTTAVPFGAKLAVLVKLRIEKDGRVSSFEIIRPSNNVIVDESVAAVAKRVTKVDPLPPGLVKGNHYDVRINFELNSEQ